MWAKVHVKTQAACLGIGVLIIKLWAKRTLLLLLPVPRLEDPLWTSSPPPRQPGRSGCTWSSEAQVSWSAPLFIRALGGGRAGGQW